MFKMWCKIRRTDIILEVIMKAKELRKKYPNFWVAIEAAVWYDMLLINNKPEDKEHPFNVHPDHAKRIAYNAAFNATYEYHKRTKKK